MMRAIAGAVGTVVAGGAVLGGLYLLELSAKTGANVLLIVIASLAWVFTFAYGFGSRWQVTHAGRALLYVGFALALFATQVSVSAWTGSSYPFRDEIRFVLYFALAVTIANLVRTLLAERHKDRDR